MRQPRPAGPPRRARRPPRHRRSSSSASTPARSTTSGCGSRRRCAASSAASLDGRRARRGRALRRRPAASCRRASGSCASCSTASRTPPPAAPAAGAARRHPDRPASPKPRRRAAELAHRRRRRLPCSPGRPGPMADDPVEQLLARTWRPTLSYVGADGFPPARPGRQRAAPVDVAGAERPAPADVRPGRGAGRGSSEALTADPPYGATVTFAARRTRRRAGTRPPFAPWLAAALDEASTAAFGKPARHVRRGRHDPVHGHARRDVPRRPVRGHRRARARAATPTARTSSSTSRRRSSSRPNASPVSSAPTPDPDRRVGNTGRRPGPCITSVAPGW